MPADPAALTALLVLAVDPARRTGHAGGGGFIGWPLIAGSIVFMHVWLTVYAVHLGSQRGQGVYFWMFLTLFFGPFAILALLRYPVLRTCPICEADSADRGELCPVCGHAWRAGEGIEPPPRFPEDPDEDRRLIS